MLFFLLSLAIPFQTTMADVCKSVIDMPNVDKQLHPSLVYIGKHARNCIVELHNRLRDYRWSPESKDLCLDIQDDGNVALYQQVDQVIAECLEACKNLPLDQLPTIQAHLEKYKEKLEAGQAHVNVCENDGTNRLQTRSRKSKKICKLCVRCLRVVGSLSVTGSLFVNGIEFSDLAILAEALADTGLIAATGATGATGADGAGGILAFGYIFNLTAQSVAVEAPVLFDSNGPLLGVTHTPGTDAITVVDAGTYAITFSVSGSEPNQFALFINGAPDTSTVYGSGAGTQQNTGQAILVLAAGDVITLVNHTSAAAVTLASVVGGTQANVSASILIERLA